MDINHVIPLVSIVCATYNQAPYIRQCLDGFMMQKTDFPIEAIIHDDASIDGTTDIIREYEQKYPDIIKPIYQRDNQYSKGVAFYQIFIYPQAKGKYIAFCEGDDYWVDPFKLQKQIDFLENNPEYGLCYTKARVFSQKHNRIMKGKTWGRNISLLKELFYKKNPVPTLTVCLHKKLLLKYLEEIKPEIRGWSIIGDIPIIVWFMHNSKIYLINDFTGIYRIVSGSFTHPTSYEKVIFLIEDWYKSRSFLANYFNLPDLEDWLKNQRLLDFSYESIIFKQFDNYRKYITMVNGATLKIKLKKIIGKSIFFMFLYHSYLILRKKLKLYYNLFFN